MLSADFVFLFIFKLDLLLTFDDFFAMLLQVVDELNAERVASKVALHFH